MEKRGEEREEETEGEKEVETEVQAETGVKEWSSPCPGTPPKGHSSVYLRKEMFLSCHLFCKYKLIFAKLLTTGEEKKNMLFDSAGEAQRWEGGPLPPSEEREEEEWKEGEGEGSPAPKKSRKDGEAAGEFDGPPLLLSGEKEKEMPMGPLQARPSPCSDPPVCAKNISLTPSGEKVILWTRYVFERPRRAVETGFICQ